MTSGELSAHKYEYIFALGVLRNACYNKVNHIESELPRQESIVASVDGLPATQASRWARGPLSAMRI